MNKTKKIAITTMTTAMILGGSMMTSTKSQTHASTIPANAFVDKVTKVYNKSFTTKYGWDQPIIKNKSVHVGDTVELMLNTNGHSPNVEDWYTDNYIVIKHK